MPKRPERPGHADWRPGGLAAPEPANKSYKNYLVVTRRMRNTMRDEALDAAG